MRGVEVVMLEGVLKQDDNIHQCSSTCTSLNVHHFDMEPDCILCSVLKQNTSIELHKLNVIIAICSFFLEGFPFVIVLVAYVKFTCGFVCC